MEPPASRRVVVMGPSASGKTTLARALAYDLGWQFIEGDDYHPASNIEKMKRGEPLTDGDRAPWLDGIGRVLAAAADGAIASCSALRRCYRDRLRAHADGLLFILPEVPREELARRTRQRPESVLPPSLLDSQLDTFEPFAVDEQAIRLDGTLPVADEVRLVRARLGC